MPRRWEAHIWIGGINKQKYLGGYEKEEHAAEAYDMAALKTKGFDTPTNFDKSRCATPSGSPLGDRSYS